jgi:hypothetical protein
MHHLWLSCILSFVLLGVILTLSPESPPSTAEESVASATADKVMFMDTRYSAVPQRVELEYTLWPKPSNEFVQ